MDKNNTKFYCSNCKYTWKGLYIPNSCPKCNAIIRIAIDIEEDRKDKKK